MKKIYSIYFLLGLFITAFYSCGEDLTPVGPDIAEITHFRNDGPYLFYENGRLKILEVTKDNALNIREESGLPAGLKLDVYSDDNQLLFQDPLIRLRILNVRHGKTVPSMLKHLPYPTFTGVSTCLPLF